jgi:hypothetical protein
MLTWWIQLTCRPFFVRDRYVMRFESGTITRKNRPLTPDGAPFSPIGVRIVQRMVNVGDFLDAGVWLRKRL